MREINTNIGVCVRRNEVRFGFKKLIFVIRNLNGGFPQMLFKDENL